MKNVLLILFLIISGLFGTAFGQDSGAASVSTRSPSNTGTVSARPTNISLNETQYPYSESGLTAAINAAGKAASVWVSRGTIELTSPLRVPSDVRINWDGVILTSNGYDGDLLVVDGARNVSFVGKLIINGARSGEGSTSYGLDVVGVSNFTFDDLEVINTLNGCVRILGSSHIRGSKVYGNNCGRGKSTSAGFFGGNSDAMPLTDVAVDEIEINGAHNSDCVYFSGTADNPSARINVSKLDFQNCGDTGFEVNHAQQVNIGQITVGWEGAFNSGVLIRQTTDDNINSVACAGGIKICVDVGTFSESDSPIERITIGQIIATSVSRDAKVGAAVRVSANPSVPISNIIFDSIVASRSTRGFYCAGAQERGETAQQIIVNNIISYAAQQDGIYIDGCAGVLLANVIAYDNGQAGPGFAGIRGSSATNVVIGSGRFFDDQAKKTQAFGILTQGTSDRWTIGVIDARNDLETTAGISLVGSNNRVYGRLDSPNPRRQQNVAPGTTRDRRQ